MPQKENEVVASAKTQIVLRIIALVLLLSVAAVLQTASLSALQDEQIWVHLRAGTWMLEQKAWPHTALFSQAANQLWRDFSWGYDIVTALAYRVFGLRALPLLLMGFRFVLAAITFALAAGLRGSFWTAIGISAVTQYIVGALGPVSTCASVVLFGIELLLLLESRRTGNVRALCALPVLFLVWANADVGIVYGIVLYVLFLAGIHIDQIDRSRTNRRSLSVGRVWVTGAACLLASMITPYGYHGYGAFLREEFSSANEYLTAYQAMGFHRLQDYLLMLTGMAGFLALGLRRSRDAFLFSSLVAASALAFHAQRESWLVVLVSLAAIGASLLRDGDAVNTPCLERKWQAVATGMAVVLICLGCLRIPRAQDQLLAKVAETFPIGASDYIREHQLAAPLFNSYRWGSFLTWYLPQYPVAIDGRRALYSEEQETDYFRTMKVEMPYQGLEPMAQARTLLMDKSEVLAGALRDISGFQVAYEDRIAIVLLQQAKE